MADDVDTPQPLVTVPDEGPAPQPSPVSLAELSERLAMRPAEIYREIKDGNLKCSTIDSHTVFAESDITAFVEKRESLRSELAAELDRWLTDLSVSDTPAGTKDSPDSDSSAAPSGEMAPDTQENPPAAQEPEKVKDQPSEEPAAKAGRLSDALLRHAFAHGVQDVYLDPVETGFRVMYRTERGLEERGRFTPRSGELIRQALKTKLGKPDPVSQPVEALSKIDHADRKIQIQGLIAPTLLGEHVHLRFRDPLAVDDLAGLGYMPEQADAVRKVLDGRNGILLVSGAADPFAGRHRLGLADMLAAGNRLVVSLEHRVHFKSEILVQLTLSNEAGVDFSNQMAAALAMSPDVIFMDDIRNADEARGLFDAVAAGVLVVAQMRSPGNVESLLRLIEFGISKSILAKDLLGLIARRRFRRICPDCAGRRPLNAAENEMLRAAPDATIAVPRDCPHCRQGFRDRRVLQDVWLNHAELAALIAAIEPPAEALRAWGRTAEYGVTAAARAAVLAGEIALADVATLLATD